MADGRVVTVPVYEINLRWHGARRKVTAQGTEGEVLLGTNLWYGSLVTLEFAEGGTVTIEALE